jgi:hypothetical protein
MSDNHGDANWRNLNYKSQGTLDLNVGRAEVGAIPDFGLQISTMNLACGVTNTGALTTQNINPSYRSTDFAENLRYYSVIGRLQVDNPTLMDMIVESSVFNPFITLTRGVDHRWQGQGVKQGSKWIAALLFEIDVNLVGPYFLEVTSVDPYETGEFLVRPSCCGNSTLQNGVVSQPYFEQLNSYIGEGTQINHWTLLSGTLPPGVTLNSTTGVLSGTPTTVGLYSFTIQYTVV